MTCALQIKYLCHSKKGKEEDMMGKVRKLARLAGEMLNRSILQVLIEYEEDISEYYLKEIEKACLERACELGWSEEEKKYLNIKRNRHYYYLVDNMGDSDSMQNDISEKLNNDKVLRKIEDYGFYYEEEESNFIWKLGEESSYPIFFFVWLNKDEKAMEYRIRNLLQFRDELEKYIFDSEKPDYFHELVDVRNRLNVYENPKSISHTRGKSMKSKFELAANALNNETLPYKDGDSKEVLLLLADLYVGRLFRRSSTKEFYQNDDKDVTYDFKWNDSKNIFKNTLNISFHNEEEPSIEIKRWDPKEDSEDCIVKFEDERVLEDEERLLASSAERGYELQSLLLSLMMNSKQDGRGIPKSEGGKKVIKVYLSKTKEGNLRITHRNHCEKNTLKQIERCFTRQPNDEDSGITLWSLNCYLKREWVSLTRRSLRNSSDEKIRQIKATWDSEEDLSKEQFKIRPGVARDVLWYEIPVLFDKYD